MLPGVKVDDKCQEEKQESQATHKAKQADAAKIEEYGKIAQPGVQEMIVFVGSAGCGKSTFYREYLSKHYSRVNNDTVKNAKKAQKLCREALEAGKSIVVDNMNAKR